MLRLIALVYVPSHINLNVQRKLQGKISSYIQLQIKGYDVKVYRARPAAIPCQASGFPRLAEFQRLPCTFPSSYLLEGVNPIIQMLGHGCVLYVC